MQYLKNLETDQIELEFTKDQYLGLSDETKKFIKSKFRFAGSRKIWVSKCKISNAYWLNQLEKLGFVNQGAKGEKLSYAERRALVRERAERRAERYQAKAERAEKESTERYQRARQILDFIPPGQPILIGHHSERRHRGDLAKIDNNMKASCDASKKADYFEDKALCAKWTAEDRQLKSARYLINRINEGEADIRRINRTIKGEGAYSDHQPATGQRLEYLTGRLNEATDKLNFFKDHLEKLQGQLFTPETLKGKTEVLIRGKWVGVVRVNQKTVSVLNTCFPELSSQKKWPLKYNFGEVKGAR